MSTRSAGHDFLAFYTAGTFIRTGRSAELYDLPAVKAFEHELAKREGLELDANDFGPYWNPSLFAWAFVPLSLLPYPVAWWTWTGINLACFAGAMAILCKILIRDHGTPNSAPLPLGALDPHVKDTCSRPLRIDWRTWALLPLLTITSMPFVQALGHGQNTCISLLIVSATVMLWRDGRALAAGIVAGLLFYKPQLSAVLAGALVLTCGWRAMAGLAITGSAVLAATIVTLPGTLGAFLHRLPQNVAFMQVEHRYLWDRHVTLKAFWRLLVQGFAVGEMQPLTHILYLFTLAIAAAGLFAVLWKARSETGTPSRDRAIAATIVAMPLLMPFYFDYDLLLLAVPAVLVARGAIASGRIDRRLTAAWIAVAAWLIVNPPITLRTHVNAGVALMTVLAAMMIRRALRDGETGVQRDAAAIEPTQARPARIAA